MYVVFYRNLKFVTVCLQPGIEKMKLQFIGTGAADFDWSRYGEAGILGSCTTLIDDKILIDCGETAGKALLRYGVDCRKISDVVITHNHRDHFDIEVFREVFKGRKVNLYASKEVCEAAADTAEVFPHGHGDRFEVAGYEFTALPANHTVADPMEQTFLYIIKHEGKTLLYALDTADITAHALNLIGKTYFDAVVWDSTCANNANLWMNFYHSNCECFRQIRKAFRVLGNLDDRSKIIFSHRARQFWPHEPEKLAAIAIREDAFIPADGEILEI